MKVSPKMDFLKEPAIIFCIILLFIIICVVIFLYQRAISPLTERTAALEGVLSTITREGLDFKEKGKNVMQLMGAATEHDKAIETLNGKVLSLTREVKEQSKYINYLIDKLSESGTVGEIQPYRRKVAPKKKKKSVSFKSDSDEEDYEEDSEEDIKEIKKALEAKKKKER